MSKKISTLAAGNLLKLNENGQPKKLIFLQYNHYGKNEVTVLRKDSFATKAFKGGDSGRNGYNGSDLDMFCNVEYPRMLDPIIQACLVNVPIPTARGAITGDTDATVVNLYRKGFALSCNEVANQNGAAKEGTPFTYLSGSQANRIAYYDETATAVDWWLRSPYSSNNYRAYYVNTSGALYSNNVYSAYYYCPRPALALSSEIYVSDSPDSDGCYTVESAPAGEQYVKQNGIWLKMT